MKLYGVQSRQQSCFVTNFAASTESSAEWQDADLSGYTDQEETIIYAFQVRHDPSLTTLIALFLLPWNATHIFGSCVGVLCDRLKFSIEATYHILQK